MTSQPTNPWFGLSMALVGVIVGYGFAIASSGNFVQAGSNALGGGPNAVAQNGAVAAPTPAAPTAVAPEPSYDELIPFDPETDYYRGNPNAPIAMIEYSDYECPFCQRHHPTMQQALDAYGDDVVWVYRHYPLNFHPNAQPTAEAAECIGKIAGNDKFWEFSDLVFEKGSDKANHAGYAEEIGVDVTAFQNCVDSGEFAEKVTNQLAQGASAGVRGTPGTFIQKRDTSETKYVSGAQPLANLKVAIDSLL